jgi:hypothetical protein
MPSSLYRRHFGQHQDDHHEPAQPYESKRRAKRDFEVTVAIIISTVMLVAVAIVWTFYRLGFTFGLDFRLGGCGPCFSSIHMSTRGPLRLAWVTCGYRHVFSLLTSCTTTFSFLPPRQLVDDSQTHVAKLLRHHRAPGDQFTAPNRGPQEIHERLLPPARLANSLADRSRGIVNEAVSCHVLSSSFRANDAAMTGRLAKA